MRRRKEKAGKKVTRRNAIHIYSAPVAPLRTVTTKDLNFPQSQA